MQPINVEKDEAMTQSPITNESPIAVIEGPKGKAEIFEHVSVAEQALEYQVKFARETRTFNNLGEAYLTAGELAGSPT
jgi:hypothetical protein